MKKLLLLVGAVVASLAVTPLATGHATVSVVGASSALTGARTNYVLRVPNERSNRSTFRIVMSVPEAIQERISVLAMPGWNITLVTRDTGQRDAEGAPVLAVTQIIWRAKKGFEYRPKFYAEFYFRVQNPVTPQQLCFPTRQQYTAQYNARGVPRARGAQQTVDWSGPPGSATPASCINVVEA